MDNKLMAVVNTDDPMLNYEFVNPHHRIIKTYKDHDDGRLDFDVPRSKEAIKKGHTQDLPLSFFQIEEGDILGGKAWYQCKFPKLSDDLAELMARYNWGDLKYATKKSMKQRKKRSRRKGGKKEDVKIEFKRGPVILTF